MSGNPAAQGVLGEKYAAGRLDHPPLTFRYRARARYACDAMRRRSPAREAWRVLDLGAAEGRTLLEVRSLLGAGDYVGIERSADLIGSAPPLPAGVRLVQGDAGALPAEVVAGSFDAVFALAVLEHLPDPAAALREAARALKPGGILVATCPDPWWDHLSERLGLLAGDQHVMEMDRPTMERLVRGAGLEILAFERFMWAPVGFLPYLRVPVGQGFAATVDRGVRRLRLLDRLFVNQGIVARRP